MKQKIFIVYFKLGEPVEVRAFSAREAKILAQAERIKEGKFYDVTKIEELEYYSRAY